jgi:hypothetical protein
VSRIPSSSRDNKGFMSFLDNLENNLKSLESQEDAVANKTRERDRREGDRARALAVAPWAEKLKSSSFVADLLKKATLAGHAQRTKVYISWLGSTLRLEAKERKLELRPTSEGIVAVLLENNAELRTQPVELAGDPDGLVQELLKAA